ncbi:amino acid adenylation domain-containing protein [Pseudomonas bharatica]|uniref:amino acid adenylation domain-containing protein n=1 Tax=Pseudomonas bharatica TaxID=2692112 RepID=UPI003B27D93F
MQELLDSVKSLSARERKALAALLKRQGVNLYGVTPIFRREPEACALLSYAQQRQWFLWQLEPGSSAYNIPVALRLTGMLDVAALEAAFEGLVARHETLRTTFRQDGEQAVQVVHEPVPFHLPVDDVDAADLHARVAAELSAPFDLQAGPLLRVRLLRVGAGEHVLTVVQHHIVSDGWSMPIMIDELVRLYDGHRRGQAVHLPALPIQYADYAIWQRNWMEAGEQERQLGYWTAQLGGEQPVLELPTDRPRPLVQSHAGARLDIDLPPALAQKLKALARQQGVTLFMLLLASFQTLLHRYSGQADIRVGVPTANRNRAETEGLIGFFVNTQVLKAEFAADTTFGQLLQQIKHTAVQAQAHQDLPFEQLVQALQPERDLGRSPLFQVMFNHQTQSATQARQLPGLSVEKLQSGQHTAQFDLTLETLERDNGVGAALTYATALFDSASAERFARHWRNLLEGICQDVGQRVAELPLLDAQERQQILEGWNQSQLDYSREQCLPALVEAQVRATPEAVALVSADVSLSYAQLNTRSNQLAHKLRELGVGPDVLVGVALERGLEMVVSLLAILKAGGAYVPLDPDFPADRLSYMMQDSGLKLLLSQSSLIGQLSIPEGVQTLCVDQHGNWLDGYASDDLPATAGPDNLAYVIYTSGSTGLPKGVTIHHQALVNFLFSMADKPGLAAADRVLSLTSLSFDIAGLELYLPLIRGAAVVLLKPHQNKDPQALLQVIAEQQASVIQATPSSWRMILDAAPAGALKGKTILCGGEALNAELAQRLLDQAGHVWNVYGPTETTIWSARHYLTRADDVWLGKPLANTTLHIVSDDLDVLPVGARGELLIGGDGLARGYHQRPALTAERFVPDPFSSTGGRLYRTGDVARYRADGVIEYVGRLDHQVKIRGFRIELGEIEARLLEHPAVREAVVIDIDNQLAAYLVAEQDSPELRSALKAHLKAGLPDYMVPSHFTWLDRMPQTPNGKLDRKALPKPDASLAQGEYQPPRNERERQLARIWTDVLKVERVGLTDNFFALGGHSLLVITLVSRLREAFDTSLSLHDFLLLETFEDLADFIAAGERRVNNPVISMNISASDKAPLFCLPPGGGGTYAYYPLAGHLGPQRSVLGVVNKSYVVPGWKETSWDAMVGYYVEQIRTVRPHGPYNLLGWSLGGALAIEVAHSLESAGETVAFLGLVDTHLPQGEQALANDAGEEPEAGPWDGLVKSLLAFAPGIGEAVLLELIEEGTARFEDPKQTADWVMVQVAAISGTDIEALRAIHRDIGVQAEIASGYELLSANMALAQAFALKPLRVKPHCWWAGASRSDEQVAAAEALLKAGCGLEELWSETLAGVKHDDVVLAPELLDSIQLELEDME